MSLIFSQVKKAVVKKKEVITTQVHIVLTSRRGGCCENTKGHGCWVLAGSSVVTGVMITWIICFVISHFAVYDSFYALPCMWLYCINGVFKNLFSIPWLQNPRITKRPHNRNTNLLPPICSSCSLIILFLPCLVLSMKKHGGFCESVELYAEEVSWCLFNAFYATYFKPCMCICVCIHLFSSLGLYMYSVPLYKSVNWSSQRVEVCSWSHHWGDLRIYTLSFRTLGPCSDTVLHCIHALPHV